MKSVPSLSASHGELDKGKTIIFRTQNAVTEMNRSTWCRVGRMLACLGFQGSRERRVFASTPCCLLFLLLFTVYLTIFPFIPEAAGAIMAMMTNTAFQESCEMN